MSDESVVVRKTAVLRDPEEQAQAVLEIVKRIRRELSYKDLPLTLLALSLTIFFAAMMLAAYERDWFTGVYFGWSCVVSVAMIFVAAAIYIAELVLFGRPMEALSETTESLTLGQGATTSAGQQQKFATTKGSSLNPSSLSDEGA